MQIFTVHLHFTASPFPINQYSLPNFTFIFSSSMSYYLRMFLFLLVCLLTARYSSNTAEWILVKKGESLAMGQDGNYLV